MSAPASIPSAPSTPSSASSAPASAPSSTPTPSSSSTTPKSETPSSAPAPAAAPETAAPAAPRRFKLTAGGGKEIEVGPEDIGRSFGGEFEALSAAMGGEANLLRLYKQRRTEQWNAMQAAERSKRIAELKAKAAQDPDSALEALLKDAGIELDLEQLSNARVARRFELEQMTPEQREIHQLRQEKAQREAAEKARAQEMERAQITERRRAEGVAIRQAVTDAGLPESRFFFDRAALVMMQNERLPEGDPRKISGLDAKGAVSNVLNEFLGEVSWLVSALPVEELDKVLGEEVSAKYREHAVAKWKATPPPVPAPDAPAVPRDEQGRFQSKPKTFREMQDLAQGWR